MKWFLNLRIAKKLIIAFIVVALIGGFIGFAGYNSINELGNKSLPSVEQVHNIKEHMTQFYSMSNLLLSPKLTYEDKLIKYKELTTLEEALIGNIASYKEFSKTKEEEALWTEAEATISVWLEQQNEFVDLSKSITEKGIDDPSEVRYQLALKQKDHLKWIWTLSENINDEVSFTGQLDATQCALGLWLEAYESRNVEFNEYMNKIETAHLTVHSSGSQINDIIESDLETKQEDAHTIYENTTIANMNTVLETLVSMDAITEVSEVIFIDMIEMALTVNEPKYDVADEKIDEMITLVVKDADASVKSSTIQILILSLVGVVLSIFLGIFISRIITKPIIKVVNLAKQIADGNLDVSIDLAAKDEIGDLVKAFGSMTDNINEVMTNINSASEQVASGSGQVSDSSMSLSQGATEQASSIEELTASIEQIAVQTRQNAENANKAKDIALTAQTNAKRGNEQMADMLKAMAEINDSSNNISKIIKVIDDIAFQTNILALNAAVEAARAGQHGKGFAVVAEEVRNLAARSANAAKETTAMIEGSIKKVEGGTKIANETAEALDKIVHGVSQAAQLVGEIAVASNEQALGVDQVNQGITQISEVVQTTSATAEETAAASEELSSQADLLKTQVATFKLKNIRRKRDYSNDTISPDVLKMLEDMQNSVDAKNSTTKKTTKKISLSDSEFEKY